jgi:hypothetical protein
MPYIILKLSIARKQNEFHKSEFFQIEEYRITSAPSSPGCALGRKSGQHPGHRLSGPAASGRQQAPGQRVALQPCMFYAIHVDYLAGHHGPVAAQEGAA